METEHFKGLVPHEDGYITTKDVLDKIKQALNVAEGEIPPWRGIRIYTGTQDEVDKIAKDFDDAHKMPLKKGY